MRITIYKFGDLLAYELVLCFPLKGSSQHDCTKAGHIWHGRPVLCSANINLPVPNETHKSHNKVLVVVCCIYGFTCCALLRYIVLPIYLPI